jgi:hypothetical protein
MSVLTTVPAADATAAEPRGRALDRPPRDARRGPPEPASPRKPDPPPVMVCQTCGRPALVHILDGYDHGRPVLRHLCLDCDDAALPAPEQSSGGLRPGLPVLIGATGLALVVVGLFGDVLLPDRHAGFGSHQQWGVVLALVLGFIGMLLRIGPLALAGLLLLAASVSADWFGLISGPGVGYKQQILVKLGTALVLCGVLGRLRARRRHQRLTQARHPSAPHAPAGTAQA